MDKYNFSSLPARAFRAWNCLRAVTKYVGTKYLSVYAMEGGESVTS